MANYKLPPKIQDQLAKLPETGMGYQKTTLTFSDGKVVPDIICRDIPGIFFFGNSHIVYNE